MRIIVFGNQKGGVGKTTLSVGVAGSLAQQSKSVFFVDTDPQLSSSEQLLDHARIKYAKHQGGDLDTLLPKLRDFDYVIVDTPSGVNAALQSTLKVADLLVIPVKPSPYDFDSVATTIAMARAAKVRTVVVINEAIWNTRFTKQAPEALAKYKSVSVLKSIVGCRSAHREVVLHGKTIVEVKLNGGHAAKEIRSLAREIVDVLGG